MDKKHEEDTQLVPLASDMGDVCEVIFEHHTRDERGDVTFRPTNRTVAHELLVASGDWVVLLVRVHMVRREGGYLSGQLRRFKGEGNRNLSHFVNADEVMKPPRVELSPAMEESYLIGIGSSPVDVLDRVVRLNVSESDGSMRRGGEMPIPYTVTKPEAYTSPDVEEPEVKIVGVNWDSDWLRVEFSDGSKITWKTKELLGNDNE